MKIKELSNYDKPYEKAYAYGLNSLTDKELLAIILRSGTKNVSVLDVAEKILSYKTSVPNINNINKLSLNNLLDIPGIGKIKAIQIKALSELLIRMNKCNYPKRVIFKSPSDVANYHMQEMRHLSYEEFRVLYLDSKGALINSSTLFKGGISSCHVSLREVLIEALNYKSTRIIVLHNHPSGNTDPSMEDIQLTIKLYEMAISLDIKLLDHIIIGDNKFYSLKENNHF